MIQHYGAKVGESACYATPLNSEVAPCQLAASTSTRLRNSAHVQPPPRGMGGGYWMSPPVPY